MRAAIDRLPQSPRSPRATEPSWRILKVGAEAREVHVTGELETMLTHSAAEQGRQPEDLVQDVLTRYFEEEVITD